MKNDAEMFRRSGIKQPTYSGRYNNFNSNIYEPTNDFNKIFSLEKDHFNQGNYGFQGYPQVNPYPFNPANQFGQFNNMQRRPQNPFGDPYQRFY